MEKVELFIVKLVYPSKVSHWLGLSVFFVTIRREHIISEWLILIAIVGKRAKVGLAAASLGIVELVRTDCVEL
jgi:hypothetical protein